MIIRGGRVEGGAEIWNEEGGGGGGEESGCCLELSKGVNSSLSSVRSDGRSAEEEVGARETSFHEQPLPKLLR